MATKSYKIKIEIDNALATAAATKAAADLVKVEAAARRAADATEGVGRSASGAGEGLGKAAGMADQFAKGLVGLVGPLAGMAGVQAIVGGIATAFSDANAAAETMGRQVLDTLKDLREIAAIKGKYAPDDEELKRFADLRKASGLSQSEAMAFSGQLLNTLGTVSESRFGKEEREKLAVEGAKLASRMGGGEAGAHARASMMGLLPGFLKPGAPASDVVAYEDVGETILGRGAASNTMMAQQAQKVLTSLASPEMKGRIHNPLEAYALTAIASKFETEGFGTAALEFTREVSGLSRNTHAKGFDATQSEFLKRAGVAEEDDPRIRAQKVFAQIDKETNRGKDRDIEQYLKEQGFTSEIGPRRIAQFYEQHLTGLFEDVMGMADTPIDAKAPDRKFAAFSKSDTGRDLLNRAAIDAARAERGKLRTPLILARDAARADVIAEGGIDNPLSDLPTRAGLGVLRGIGGLAGVDVPKYEDFASERRVMRDRGVGRPEALGYVDMAEAALGNPGALLNGLMSDLAGQLSGKNAELVRALDENTAATRGDAARMDPGAKRELRP